MEKEKIEGNKLIADFMGWTQQLDAEERWYGAWFDQHGVRKAWPKGHEPLLFHESWDWLMPVVEKIHDIFESEEEDIPPYIYQCEEFLLIRDELCTGRLPESWSAVVDFIKWYNENNKTNDNTGINY